MEEAAIDSRCYICNLCTTSGQYVWSMLWATLLCSRSSKDLQVYANTNVKKIVLSNVVFDDTNLAMDAHCNKGLARLHARSGRSVAMLRIIYHQSLPPIPVLEQTMHRSELVDLHGYYIRSDDN